MYLSLVFAFTMFKRPAADSAPPAKGGPGAQCEEKTDPIPRQLPVNSVTLNFSQRGWDSFVPGKLYMFLAQRSPKYMFDANNVKLFNKFKNLWHTMEIHQPTLKLSNFIFLQDDIRVQAGTPVDATAFTQVNYFISYEPRFNRKYFKLVRYHTAGLKEYDNLTYVNPQHGDSTHFVTLEGFNNFEALGVIPSKMGIEAGFKPNSEAVLENGVIKTDILPPNCLTPNLDKISGNLIPPNNKYMSPSSVIGLARNQDSIKFHKYGETVDIPIETNLNGIKLVNSKLNNFLENNDVYTPNPADPSGVQQLVFKTEWSYPSKNRPYFHRGNYYDPHTNPITGAKHHFKPLKNTFICLSPIRVPNGNLLGQRVSYTFDSTISITFHFNTNTFDDDDDLNAEFLAQDSGVILRPNFYPSPKVTQEPIDPDPPKEEKDDPMCKNGQVSGCRKPSPHDTHMYNEDLKCYSTDWDGLAEFIGDVTLDDELYKQFYSMFSFVSGKDDQQYSNIRFHFDARNSYYDPFIFNEFNGERNKDYRAAWINATHNNKNLLFILENEEDYLNDKCIKKVFDNDDNTIQYYNYIAANWTKQTSTGVKVVVQSLVVAGAKCGRYLKFDMKEFVKFYFSNTTNLCKVSYAKASDFEPERRGMAFFC